MARARVMHQTTIRFGHELWQSLELAADEGGMSVAQYVREAAIERLVRGGAHGDDDAMRSVLRFGAAEPAFASERESSTAPTAQSRLGIARPRELRADADADVARDR